MTEAVRMAACVLALYALAWVGFQDEASMCAMRMAEPGVAKSPTEVQRCAEVFTLAP